MNHDAMLTYGDKPMTGAVTATTPWAHQDHVASPTAVAPTPWPHQPNRKARRRAAAQARQNRRLGF